MHEQVWKLKNDNVVAVHGKLVSFDGNSGDGGGRKSFQATKVYDIGELRSSNCKEMTISSDLHALSDATLHKLEEIAMDHQNAKGLSVKIHLKNHQDNEEFDVRVMPDNKVLPSNIFIEALDEVMPDANIRFE